MFGNDQILLVYRDFAKWRVKKKKNKFYQKSIFSSHKTFVVKSIMANLAEARLTVFDVNKSPAGVAIDTQHKSTIHSRAAVFMNAILGLPRLLMTS